ncbi:MAG TPA: sigma 54-interacting transcriptional regulator, partial [bacterium]|nr:sigma 54-interacting transcriptional regulator [bacterium]
MGSSGSPTETVVVGGKPTAIRFQRCRVRVIDGPDRGMEVTLGQRTIRVGTAAENDFRLTDKGVSRHHCEIVAREEGFLVRDLASKNGVYLGPVLVREALIREPVTLRLANDVIEFVPGDDSVEVPLPKEGRFGEAIGSSAAMREVFASLTRAAASDANVLLEGETGTGKELLAHGLHLASRRATRPYVVVDCGAIPADLVESELFGHVKGSFTGAVSDKAGLFESAEGGTVFLDEVGELDREHQPKLLRVLESGEVRRVGAQAMKKIDVRVVAATHRDLVSEVAAGRFRQDLYYRLAVVNVRVPPLRERKDDVAVIAEAIAADLRAESPETVDPGAAERVAALLARYREYSWPGNVRELRN